MIGTIRASTFACATIWCVIASAQTKASEPPSPFPTRISNCPNELASALPSVIRLEVDALLRERGLASPPESVAVQCEGDSARITVSAGGATRDTNVDLSPLAAPHRARAVALAAAELLHSLANAADDEASKAPSPAPPPTKPPPRPTTSTSPPSTPAPPPRHASTAPALLVGALGEWLGKPATPLFGARVALRYPLTALVVPALSADASFGSASTTSARVAARTFGAGAHLYFSGTTGNFRWSAGPGARIAGAVLVG
ncbi:MAG TPA: hypothetical protein VFQ35_10275 [Polyangiaceae bacterium]|nr:hypothetical protein [Polyangiaceae bacterium]